MATPQAPKKAPPQVPLGPKPSPLGGPSIPSSPKPSLNVSKPVVGTPRRNSPIPPSPLSFPKSSVPTYLAPDYQQKLSKDERLFRNKKKQRVISPADRESEEGFDLPKNQWLSYALKKHPEILEMHERLRPFTKVESFGRLNSHAKTEVAEVLSGKEILQLIIEHLQLKGYHKSCSKLEEESKLKFSVSDVNESRLLTLLRMGITDVDKVFDDTLPVPLDKDGNPEKPDDDEEVEVFGEGFAGSEEKDVNIWDEPDDGKNLVMPEGQLGRSGTPKAGTLNKLLERLTADESPNRNFWTTFFLTYQSFTTPERLLQKFIQRYHVPIPKGKENDEEWKIDYVRPVQERVCKALKYWVENFFVDFVRDNIVPVLKQFIENNLARDGLHQYGKEIKGIVVKSEGTVFFRTPFAPEPERRFGDTFVHPLFQIRPQDVSQMSERVTANAPEPRVPMKLIFSRTLQVLDIEEEEVARQLTTIDFEIFSALEPVELLNNAWMKPKYQHRCPNVRNLMHRHRNFSLWVAQEILKATKLKMRVRVWMKFVKIAEHLRALRNFHSMCSVIRGLTHESTARLRWTKEGAQKQCGAVFNEMEKLMAPEGRYATFWKLLENISNGSAPFIPFLGVFLDDLQRVEEDNPDYINGLINFGKCNAVRGTLQEIMGAQKRAYNMQPVHQIQTLILNIQVADEEELMKMSLEIEPKDCDRNQCQ